jgi:DNA-binding PadR family transcriptional regulator
MRKRPDGFSDPSLLLLTSLSDGPKHGYAMIEDISRLSGVRLGPGTLYGAIARLEARGLIEAIAADDRRRPYRITAQGVQVLRAEIDTIGRIARIGGERIGRLQPTADGSAGPGRGAR